MSRRRRKSMHPIIREIKKRQREIARLSGAAKLIGLDLTPIHRNPETVSPKKAAEYHRQMAERFQAPLEPAVKPKPKAKKPDKQLDQLVG